jgi:Mrr restriction endonuclease-like protein
MDKKMHQELVSWRTSLAGEITGLEAQLQQIRSALAEKQAKVSAIDSLIGQSAASPAPARPAKDVTDLFEDRVFTPTKAYWRPLMQALVELGGRGTRERVIEMVGEKMKNVLHPADYRKLPQSSFVRWENRVAWQASNMRREGYLKNNSPRGIWEITDAGRKWLEDNS